MGITWFVKLKHGKGYLVPSFISIETASKLFWFDLLKMLVILVLLLKFWGDLGNNVWIFLLLLF